MNEIEKCILVSEFPKLTVKIGQFKNKNTGEFGFAVMSVATGIDKKNTVYIYDASEWEHVKDYEVEGTERIQEAFHAALLSEFDKSGDNHYDRAKDALRRLRDD